MVKDEAKKKSVALVFLHAERKMSEVSDEFDNEERKGLVLERGEEGEEEDE